MSACTSPQEGSACDWRPCANITDRIGSYKLAGLTTPRLNTFRDDLLTTMSRARVLAVLRKQCNDSCDI